MTWYLGEKNVDLNERVNAVDICTQESKNKICNAHIFYFNLCKCYLDMGFGKVMIITKNYSKNPYSEF